MRKCMLLCSALFLTGSMLLLSGQVYSEPNIEDIAVIAGEPSEVSELTFREVRKIYLGYPLTKNGSLVVPLINKSDPALYEAFVRNVLLMSPKSYQRYLISRVFQLGGKPPEIFLTPTELNDHLEGNRDSITYIWFKDAEERSDIRIVSHIQLD